jgi:hypothetical protein
MDLQTVLFFGMGMMVEVFNILRSNEGLPTRKNIFKYLFVFAFPLSALLPGKKEKELEKISKVESYQSWQRCERGKSLLDMDLNRDVREKKKRMRRTKRPTFMTLYGKNK